MKTLIFLILLTFPAMAQDMVEVSITQAPDCPYESNWKPVIDSYTHQVEYIVKSPCEISMVKTNIITNERL